MVVARIIKSADSFVRLTSARQDINKDNMICVSGPKGSGKSNTSMVLALKDINFHNKILKTGKRKYRRVRENAQPLRWNFKSCMPYTVDEIKERSDNPDVLAPYSPMVVDEAIEAVYKRDALARSTKDIIKRFNKNRTRKIISYWCVPDFLDLDRDMRKMFNYHIYVMWRNGEYSINLVFRRSISAEDPWNLDLLRKRVQNIWEEISEQEAWDIVKKLRFHPNLIGVFRIKALPEKFYSKYEDVREDGVFRREQSLEEPPNKQYLDLNNKYETVLFNLDRLFNKNRGDKKKLWKAMCKLPGEDDKYVMSLSSFSHKLNTLTKK